MSRILTFANLPKRLACGVQMFICEFEVRPIFNDAHCIVYDTIPVKPSDWLLMPRPFIGVFPIRAKSTRLYYYIGVKPD